MMLDTIKAVYAEQPSYILQKDDASRKWQLLVATSGKMTAEHAALCAELCAYALGAGLTKGDIGRLRDKHGY